MCPGRRCSTALGSFVALGVDEMSALVDFDEPDPLANPHIPEDESRAARAPRRDRRNHIIGVLRREVDPPVLSRRHPPWILRIVNGRHIKSPVTKLRTRPLKRGAWRVF